ncbi:MAG: hypothetical protein Q8N95_11335 [Desulfobacterales bacterium]|nr:hypothetical protein [Desulfobacterales bacterium]
MMSLFKRRQTKKRKSGTPLKWFVIISIVVAIMAAVLGVRGGVIDFIENYFSYKDNSYRPVDIDRSTLEPQNKKPDKLP